MPSNSNGTNELVLDALIVGAGFSGLTVLHKLRQHGFIVKVYEGGSELGGTWFWNRYPGSRVDSEVPVYQLQFGDEEEKKIWKDFEWNERFPGREEIMAYFRHADEKLGFSKDVRFNTWVTSAHFDDAKNMWLVTSKMHDAHGSSVRPSNITWARHLVLCTGALVKPYLPSLKGLNTFSGQILHSAEWPEEEVEMTGKTVAIIGTGASGVQIIQEIGPSARQLTVYQRTPNLAIPMHQRWRGNLPEGRTENDGGAPWHFPPPAIFPSEYDTAKGHFGGMNFDGLAETWKDSTPLYREAVLESQWRAGGLRQWASFSDAVYDEDANDAVYAFWAKKVRARITDPKKRDILAPLKKPHAWGTKRASLEQNYYEVLNQDNVDIINVRESPILQITHDGVETKEEGVIPVDVLILATGFDAQTGTILGIDIKNGTDESLSQKWNNGIRTRFGMSVSRFPNMYFFYGPQAPFLFSNGPTCAAVQAEWLTNLMVAMRKEGKTRVELTKEAEDDWVQHHNQVWYETLMPNTDSLYLGANIPGKRREPLSYYGGIPTYVEALKQCVSNNYEGFILA